MERWKSLLLSGCCDYHDTVAVRAIQVFKKDAASAAFFAKAVVLAAIKVHRPS